MKPLTLTFRRAAGGILRKTFDIWQSYFPKDCRFDRLSEWSWAVSGFFRAFVRCGKALRAATGETAQSVFSQRSTKGKTSLKQALSFAIWFVSEAIVRGHVAREVPTTFLFVTKVPKELPGRLPLCQLVAGALGTTQATCHVLATQV